MNNAAFAQKYLSGASLYGDDFDEGRIHTWYQQEEHSYYGLTRTYAKYVYSYHSLNALSAYRFLTARYPCCLAMGSARGDDVAPLASQVDVFVVIEPEERWWCNRIAGTRADYRKPSVNGDIALPDASVDLVVCFEVLHHIPNAGHVLSEMARVLRPGGAMVLREPICTMGDWRGPRAGLTPNERGFPPGWLDERIALANLRIVRKSHCCFPLITRLARLLRLEPAYNNRFLVRLDAVCSWLTKWNLHYHRDAPHKKIAPIDAAYVLTKA